MVPNILWMLKPAPHDILKGASLAPVLDGFMSVFQVLFVGAMCDILRKEKHALRFTPWLLAAALSAALYYGAWGFTAAATAAFMFSFC